MKVVIAIFLVMQSLHANASCVILLHGLARTSGSMQKIEQSLHADQYHVINVEYPSRHYAIEELSEMAIPSALKQCSHKEVNFVTHSLGGIMLRQYLSTHDIPQLNRVVMLGPPNQGSEVVDRMRDVPGFAFINGKAGLQLGTNQDSVPNRLGKAEFDLGIIAGSRSINLILSLLIPGNDDGKVSIERTKLEGMNDHIVIPTTHTFMMRNKQVINQISHYLKHGKFTKENKD